MVKASFRFRASNKTLRISVASMMAMRVRQLVFIQVLKDAANLLPTPPKKKMKVEHEFQLPLCNVQLFKLRAKVCLSAFIPRGAMFLSPP